jgi:hypothetical protein
MESIKRKGTTEMTTGDTIFLVVIVLAMIGFVVGSIFLLKWLSSGSSSDNNSKPKKNKSKENKSKESHASKNLKNYLNSNSSKGSKSSKSSKSSKKKKDKFENVLNNEDKIVGFNINYLNNYANV